MTSRRADEDDYIGDFDSMRLIAEGGEEEAARISLHMYALTAIPPIDEEACIF